MRQHDNDEINNDDKDDEDDPQGRRRRRPRTTTTTKDDEDNDGDDKGNRKGDDDKDDDDMHVKTAKRPFRHSFASQLVGRGTPGQTDAHNHHTDDSPTAHHPPTHHSPPTHLVALLLEGRLVPGGAELA